MRGKAQNELQGGVNAQAKELQRGIMPKLLSSLSNYETKMNKEMYSTPTQLVQREMCMNLPHNRQAATTAATSKCKAVKSKLLI